MTVLEKLKVLEFKKTRKQNKYEFIDINELTIICITFIFYLTAKGWYIYKFKKDYRFYFIFQKNAKRAEMFQL